MFEIGAVNRTAILKAVAVAAVFAVMFCIGCGDKNPGGGGGGGEKRSAHLITFEPNGGTLKYYRDTTGADGKLASLPTPEYEGYTFNGWFTADTGGAKVDTSTVFSKADTVYAQWTPNKYAVTFDSKSGSAVSAQSIEHGGKATLPTAPTRANYTFGGWYKDTLYTAAWDFAVDTVMSAITLYAKWTLNIYAVTFDSKGGSAVSAQSIEHGGKLTEPTAPTRANHTLVGWYKDTLYTAEWDFADDTVTSAITLYAKWTLDKYAVTFDSKSGSAVSPQSIEHGGKATLPTAPTRANYTLVGWYKEDKYTNVWDFAVDTVTSAITLYAKWTLDKYAVTFDPKGGGAVSPQSVEHGGKVTKPKDPTRAGGTFGGWYKEDTYTAAWDFAVDTVTSAVTLYAKWTLEKYAVTFDSRGGGAVSAQSIEHGGKATLPTAPARANYTFGGWYRNTLYLSAWDFAADTVTSAITLYAKWTLNIYAVTFDSNGGGAVSAQSIEHGGKVMKPKDPVRAGGTFGGWYKEDTYTTAWDFDADTVTSAITLYAKWTLDRYAVTFDSKGGAAVSAQSIEHGGKVTEPAAQTRDGYTFGGWFKEATYIDQWIFAADAVTTNVTLYAKWTPITYRITYDLAGGAVSSTPSYGGGASTATPATFTFETAGFTLTRPTRLGWTFEGWTGTGITSPNKTVSIPQGSTGDRAYTANWAFWTSDPTFVDERDGTTYKKVKIGTQVWMAENLNYNVEGSRCYEGSLSKNGVREEYCTTNSQGVFECVSPSISADESCAKYGRMYSAAAALDGAPYSSSTPSGVQGACPVGWHVPSSNEWGVLVNYAGGYSTGGIKLKSTGETGSDELGFSALAGGRCSGNSGSCSLAGDAGYWWSTTQLGTGVNILRMSQFDLVESSTSNVGGDWWASLRCVQD
jgi:uncharacterized protein (TIGR02145 family)/uncharacterized repeat protein (TIGR02543 family)